MPPNRFESEVESFLEGSHGDRTHIKRADHPRLHHYAGRYFALLTTQCNAALSSAMLPRNKPARGAACSIAAPTRFQPSQTGQSCTS